MTALVDRVLGFIVDAYDTRPVASVSFYPAPYIRFALARLWRSIDDVEHASAEGSPKVVPRLRAILDGVEEQVIAAQRSDGGWGTSLTTALHLGMFGLARARFDPEQAVLFLAATQEPDGLWPREPLYVTPGKDAAPYCYGSRSVTTAMCLQGLALARSTRGLPRRSQG